jgi:hypothetical protein
MCSKSALYAMLMWKKCPQLISVLSEKRGPLPVIGVQGTSLIGKALLVPETYGGNDDYQWVLVKKSA